MASLLQQPNEFGLAVGPNVYVVDGLGSANRYVLTVYVGAAPIATIKQTPNPAGVGIFDVQQILQSYLSNAYVESTPQAAPTPGAAIRYRVRYGTQTGDATPSYTDYSPYKVVINGYKPFNDLNWLNQQQYIAEMDGVTPCEGAGESDYSSCPIAEVKFLTSYPETRDYSDMTGVPEKKVYIDDYHTLSYANFHTNSWDWLDINNRSPWSVQIKYYNAAGTNYETRGYIIDASKGLDVRTTCQSGDWSMDNDKLIGTIGTGPQNLQDAGLWPTTAPAYYRVELYSKGCYIPSDCDDIVDVIDSSLCLWAVESFELTTECSPFEPIQLSFLNEFGVRDYYTFTKRNTYTEAVQRNNYFRDAGTWSAGTYSVESYERGTQTFNSTATARMMLSTDWVTNEVANWLEILYTSPEAKIFYEGQWIAVTITSAEYQQKSVARDNKMFRYELMIEFAQPQQRQRG